MLSPVKPVHAQVAGNIDEGQRLDGWRREQTTPSLAEVFGSIRTRPTGPMWRKLLPFSAPAISSPSATWTPATGRPRSPAARSSATRCSSSRCSPTSWRSSCSRSARGSPSPPGAISRRPAATPSRAGSPGRSGSLAELAICATDLAEVIGTAIGLNLLFGIPLEIGVIITALDVFLILWLQKHRLPLDRGLHHHAARRDRGLLRHPDRDGRSGLGRGDPRLRADDRDRHQSRHALSRARHHRRDGDAAQPLPALGHRADARLSATACRRSARR